MDNPEEEKSDGAESPRGLWQSPRWRQCWLWSEKRSPWRRSATRLQSFPLLFLTSWRLMEGTSTMPNRPGTCFHLYLYCIRVHCLLICITYTALGFAIFSFVLILYWVHCFSLVLALLRSSQFLCNFLRILSPFSLSITHITQRSTFFLEARFSCLLALIWSYLQSIWSKTGGLDWAWSMGVGGE